VGKKCVVVREIAKGREYECEMSQDLGGIFERDKILVIFLVLKFQRIFYGIFEVQCLMMKLVNK
jgi:hypothetical protein